MERRKHRLLAWALALSLILGLVPTAWATEGDPLGQDSGTLECVCAELCTEGSVYADCPVCGADEADLTTCEGAETSTPSNTLTLAAEQVQEQIDALPSLGELQAMTAEQQQTAYMEIQDAYKAYEALSDEEKTAIEGAEVFESLLGFFTSLPPVTHDNGTPVPGTEQLSYNVNTGRDVNPIVYYGGNSWLVIGYNDVGMVGKEGVDGDAPIATLLRMGKNFPQTPSF